MNDAAPAPRLRLPVFLLATVFCSGAAVMIVEMTAVRALQPFFGSSTYVWTNVIGVVLAALSAGYAIGGWVADRRPSAALLYGLLAAGGLLVATSAMLVTPLSKALLPPREWMLNLEGISSALVKGSLAVTLIVFAPATLLLGMISPLAIKLLAQGGVGRAAGRVFAVSTVGSIVGTYLPAFWLVPWIGSRGAIFVAAGLLLIPAAVGLAIVLKGRRSRFAVWIIVALGVQTGLSTRFAPARGAPALVNDGVANVVAEVESPYQYLTVREDWWEHPRPTTWRILTINEGVYTYHSYEVEGSVLTGSRYYDDYTLLPFHLERKPGSPLRVGIVGFAAGTNARQWKHFFDGVYDLHVDGAEIDPDVVRLGREHFSLPGPEAEWLAVHVVDGRRMVEAAEDGRWDVIVLDAFANEFYIPFHLATREFFEACRARLKPDGLLAMNVYAVEPKGAVSRPDYVEPANLRAIRNTLAAAFGVCLDVRQRSAGSHLLLACANGEPIDRDRFTRLRSRFPDVAERAEFDGLLPSANWIADRGTGQDVRPSPNEIVLTDDHAPIEHLADEAMAAYGHARALAEAGDGRGWEEWELAEARHLRTLDGIQNRWLVFIAAGWVAVLGTATAVARRGS